ncbi:unnamed protein product, partial [Tetraodon nigroviridis]
FNVGTAGAKIFTGPAAEEFGYQVQQATNHEGKWLLVSAPWSGYSRNRKGDLYKCPVSESRTSCDKLNLQDSLSIPDVKNVNDNTSLGLTLAQNDGGDLLMCGPLWGQQCSSQRFYPGICARLSPLFQPQPAFSPAVQVCGGPMDVVIVLDGSNSIYPWEPMTAFIQKLIPSLDIGPQATQLSIIQYGVDPKFEFRLNQYRTKEDALAAASRITQMYGHSTNTFQAIQYASQWGFHQNNGGRPEAAKVMVVVTDGESHDVAFRESVLDECDKKGITRFGIAVLGYYIRNSIDTENLIAEIKSIASKPTANYFFNVSEEAALSNIAGTLGDRIFNIEGTGKAGDNFKMEMSQVGFSVHYSSQQDVMMLGAVGAYSWSGTVVHQTGSTFNILPSSAFRETLQDKNHSSLLGYSVTTLNDGRTLYFVGGAPRSNHTGQVIVYTLDAQKQATVIDSEKGKQIGSYFGSVLCSLDVDRDGVTDLLLVGAPMFMNELKKEEGRVYIFSVTKGVLNELAFLRGSSPTEDARFGMAISAIPDLDLDGYSDVVVGAPLEDNQKGVIYIYNGDKKTLNKEFSQRILGSSLDPKLQYFGRSLDSLKDLNQDSLPDISVGAYGKVVQLCAAPAIIGANNPGLSFQVAVKNKKENAYNSRVLATFSDNLYYSSVFPVTEEVKCTLTPPQTVTCHVGYPAIQTNKEIKLTLNFDYNLQLVQEKAEVNFEAKREANINFYVVDSPLPAKTAVKTFDDIGPEFNVTAKVSTGNFPVSLLYLSVALPASTKAGNQLLYVTGVDTDGGSVTCDSSSLVDPLNIGVKSHTQTFSAESLRQTDKLDCKNAKCQYLKCILKDIEVNSNYFIKVSTRIWSGTFITATYQSIELTSSISVETTNPDLLLINPKVLPVALTVSKPGEKGDVPVGVIVGSVIAGLLLLALAVGLLWKFGFFKRKYQQLQKEADDEQLSRPHVDEVL